jgi:hypothetical protein
VCPRLIIVLAALVQITLGVKRCILDPCHVIYHFVAILLIKKFFPNRYKFVNLAISGQSFRNIFATLFFKKNLSEKCNCSYFYALDTSRTKFSTNEFVSILLFHRNAQENFDTFCRVFVATRNHMKIIQAPLISWSRAPEINYSVFNFDLSCRSETYNRVPTWVASVKDFLGASVIPTVHLEIKTGTHFRC